MACGKTWTCSSYWNGTSLQTYANASASDLVSGSPDPAKWNYNQSVAHEPWNVGSGSEELNGTFDMMGNVWEWMESPYYSGDYFSGSLRAHRGGSCFNTAPNLSSSISGGDDPYDDYFGLGFRVASVPEPATLLLLTLGSLLLRKRRA